MNRFSIFRWKDFLTFGMVALFSTILSIYTIITAENLQLSPKLLLLFTSTTFWAIYVFLLYYRNKWLNKINFIYKNVGFIFNDFKISNLDIEAEVDKTLYKWDAAVHESILIEEKKPHKAWKDSKTAIENTIVIFKTFPVQHGSSQKNLAGYTLGDNIVVGYLNPISKSALAHELGHRIHKAYTGKYDEEESHNFMKKYNLS